VGRQWMVYVGVLRAHSPCAVAHERAGHWERYRKHESAQQLGFIDRHDRTPLMLRP
jgi:hypothetical protein